MSTKRRRPVQAKRRMGTKNILVMAACLALVAVVSVGGTIAWLTATTDAVTNTFTVGNIDIKLNETFNKDTNNDGVNDAWEQKMVPGNTIAKDPKVTVLANSEACWLFVKVEKSTNLAKFIDYNIADGWTSLNGVDGVYYREVPASTSDQAFNVLKDDRVTVKDDVTKEMMDELKETNAIQPTLTFTAYAVQKDNVASAADAWAKLSTSTTP